MLILGVLLAMMHRQLHVGGAILMFRLMSVRSKDPRSGLLPPGWRRMVYEKYHVIAQSVNVTPVEGFDQKMKDNGFLDPRLT